MDSTQPTSRVDLGYITHLVWDDDENESLCGLDVSGYTWEDPLFPWNVTTPWDCLECSEISIFLEVFNYFNTTYDVKTSLEAAVQARSSGVSV